MLRLANRFLGSKFVIKDVHFQDPVFNLTDVEFLERRGRELALNIPRLSIY
jgi:hypothetical protein